MAAGLCSRTAVGGFVVMSAEGLLARLERVTQCASDRWRATCPAHESRNGSQTLSVRELPDGTLLIKCFAGCEITAVLSAVGLELSDLFPCQHRAPIQGRPSQRPRHYHMVREALTALAHDSMVVVIAAEQLAGGVPLNGADMEILWRAAARIRSIMEEVR